MNKIRKNKTKLEVKWPASHFTIDELNKVNSDFVNITLRVRLKNAIDNKQVVELGTLHMGKGRPKIVFACVPVSDVTIQSARELGVDFHDSYNSVTVSSVSSNQPSQATTSTVTQATHSAKSAAVTV